MGTNYETAMRRAFPNYATLEEEARATAGLKSKPTVGRYVAGKLDCGSGSAVHLLAGALRSIMPTSSAIPAGDLVEDDPNVEPPGSTS